MELPGTQRRMEFGSLTTNGKAIAIHSLVFFTIFTTTGAQDTEVSRLKKEEEQAIKEEGEVSAAWDGRRKNRSKKGRLLRWWSENEQLIEEEDPFVRVRELDCQCPRFFFFFLFENLCGCTAGF
ncbi:hypothetical protein QJS04_geneDACA002460 [Acorus gramineus]|uniref:Uncharacterized protein n=1 Tax=Acorus gramineus TaxID=55184 RepID=A0AAV9A066_ACOGR|nr:hypothetical protein QJS04_geneDACA002460 [Acorus gramineus]